MLKTFKRCLILGVIVLAPVVASASDTVNLGHGVRLTYTQLRTVLADGLKSGLDSTLEEAESCPTFDRMRVVDGTARYIWNWSVRLATGTAYNRYPVTCRSTTGVPTTVSIYYAECSAHLTDGPQRRFPTERTMPENLRISVNCRVRLHEGPHQDDPRYNPEFLIRDVYMQIP